MKKTLFMLSLILGVLSLGVSQAYAVPPPLIDGLISPVTEWDNNVAYSYYLKIDDPNEPLITDTYDIKTAVLLQDLSDLDPSKHGVYFMLTTWATPPSLVDVDQTAVRASLALFGDFNGDGTANSVFPFPPDVQIYITNINSGSPASDPVGADKVYVCFGPAGSCDAINGTLIWDAGAPQGFAIGAGFQYARSTDAIEMFLKTGTFGTPANVPFPQTFRGCASYDDGSTNPDDVACGSNAIPEPNTMILMASGLFSLLGFAKFKFWQ